MKVGRKENPLITAVANYFDISRPAARQRIVNSKRTEEEWWRLVDPKEAFYAKVQGHWQQFTKDEIDQLMQS